MSNLIGKGVEGIVYLESTTLPVIDKLIKEGFPVVLPDRPLDGNEVSYIDSVNEEGAYQAITFLIEHGHRRIVFIFGPRNLETAHQRYVGYRRALSEYGIAFDLAKRNTAGLIEKTIPFTAVFSSNDLISGRQTCPAHIILNANLVIRGSCHGPKS